MRKQIKIWGVMVMIVLVSANAVALQKPVTQQSGTSTLLVLNGQEEPALQQAGTTHQLVIGAQDAITASDAGGGNMTARDLIIVVVITFAVIGLIAVF